MNEELDVLILQGFNAEGGAMAETVYANVERATSLSRDRIKEAARALASMGHLRLIRNYVYETTSRGRKVLEALQSV